MKTYENHSLLPYNTFGVDVDAQYLVEYDSEEELVQLLSLDLLRENKFLHIGGGSNLLFIGNYQGVILHSHIMGIEVKKVTDTDVFVRVGAGVVWDDFVAYCVAKNYGGVENLSLIPGEVGATPIQNIGAYGVEVKDVIRTVYCYDTVEEEFVSFDVDECEYGYRDSVFKDPEVKGRYIVTHVVFELSREPRPCLEYGHLKSAVEAVAASDTLTPALIRKVIIKTRKEKLPEPSVMGSAGSFFKNPVISLEHFQRIESAAKAEHGADYKVPHYDLPDGVKVPAAWMIEQCGWKGRRSGGAAVYEKQPLVIVNYTGEAYPEEIIGLERRIIASVKDKFGVELHPEVDHI